MHESAVAPGSSFRRAAALFLCGASALFWELVLIRWLGSCVRIVAYYSNFVLMAAFFGLGAGALLAGRRVRLHRAVVVVVSAAVLLGVALAAYHHLNPGSADEFIWIGSPLGVLLAKPGMEWVNLWFVLPLVYVVVAAVFVVFGQWIGQLFRGLPPLTAYSVEIGGSIAGIVLFAVLSAIGTGPTVWFVVGFALVAPIVSRRPVDLALALVGAGAVLVLAAPFARDFVWSPYYRIHVAPLDRIIDPDMRTMIRFKEKIGHVLSVNNDYHQMILDLRPRSRESQFQAEWRALYDAPYRDISRLPPGPILVVGAGTGNDVAAALRRTDRQVYAVEIDPSIVEIGRRLHPERPYHDPRVTVVIGDARSFFSNSEQRFALVVFGFLDSHTLLSSFSSLRLDNFVYTLESMQQVRRILAPGGKAALTFASFKRWLHHRFIALLEEAFGDAPLVMSFGHYPNGYLYESRNVPAQGAEGTGSEELLPEDDWPYLYLRGRTIPSQYRVYLLLVVGLGFLPLLSLPRGRRRIRLPYFFLGAAFFLVETSNVISLSLLYGSTWFVNVLVFAGILVLVLLGNLLVARASKPRFPLWMGLLTISVGVAAFTPTSFLLDLGSPFLRAVLAVAVFLAPVLFAAMIFATLIKEEDDLYQAYGSNVLGAVVGGACEYLSLIFGFKFLMAVTLLFYGAAYLLVPRSLRGGRGPHASG